MSHPQPSARVSTGMGGCAGKAAGRCSASCAVDADAAALSGAGKQPSSLPEYRAGQGRIPQKRIPGRRQAAASPAAEAPSGTQKRPHVPHASPRFLPSAEKRNLSPARIIHSAWATYIYYTASFPFRQCNKRTFPGRIRKNPLSRTKNAQFEHFRRFCPLALARQM